MTEREYSAPGNPVVVVTTSQGYRYVISLHDKEGVLFLKDIIAVARYIALGRIDE